MKTWTKFLEDKYNEANAQLAPMAQQPAEYQPGFRPNYKSQYKTGNRPNYNPQTQATQQVAPVSDEEMGAQYANSMQVQQARAKAQMGQGQRQV